MPSFSKISSAALVQTKGFGSRLLLSRYWRIVCFKDGRPR